MIDRIRSRSVFSRIRRDGFHFRSGPLSCTMIRDDSLPGPAVGYSIGRSVGTAVERNRLRRQLRAIVKNSAAAIAPGTYVFGAAPRATKTSFSSLARHVDRLIVQMTSPEVHAVGRKGRAR